MSWHKMERGWLDNPFFQSAEYSERDAWVWMIGEAAFDSCTISVKGQPFPLEKGQIYSSIRFMAQKFRWSTGKVQRFIDRLLKWGMIETQTDTGQNLITICNYSKYQDRKTDVDTPSDTPIDTPTDTQATQAQIQTVSPSIPSSPSRDLAATIVAAPPQPKVKKPKGEGKKTLEAFLLDAFQKSEIPQDWGEWAYATGRMTVEEINFEWETMVDWAKGKGEKKSDWKATWQNWCRRFIKQKNEKEQRDELFAKRRSKF